jgi:hypothetical protein
MSQVVEQDSKINLLLNDVCSLESSLIASTNIKQLSKLLNNINETQREIDSTLETYATKNTFQHQSNIRSLELSRVELSSTINHSRNLKKILENANSLSYKITERVRILDSEKSDLIKIKSYVDNVKTLKAQLSRANDAIIRKDWLVASKSISIIRELPKNIINDSYVEFKVPTSTLEDLPSDILFRWINQLEELFTFEFNEAAKNRDVAKLTYFFQLFPLIGKADVGLKYYSLFICGIISESSRSIIRNVQNTQQRSEFYAQLLFRLYQTISEIVNQHSKVIKLYYGGEVMNRILKDIQMECDFQSNLIYETYADSKHLDRLIDEVKQYGYPILIKEIYKNTAEVGIVEEQVEELETENEIESIELMEIAQVTDELSAMMNHWSMYSKFFVVVWNEYLSTSKAKENKKYEIEDENGTALLTSRKEIYPSPLILSSFGIKIYEKLVRQFDLCATYTIRRTLEKACTIESLGSLTPQFSVCLKFLTLVFKKIENSTSHSLYNLISEEPAVSSLADDIIIVLNTILLEVLATGELSSIKNMISNVKRVLLNDFLNIIQQRLTSLSLKSTSNLLTKDTIQKIHQQQNPLLEKSNLDSNPRSRSSTPVGLNVSASDIANTGAIFMRSLNAAINYSMTGDIDGESYFVGDDTDIKQYVIYLNTLEVMSSYLEKLVVSCMKSFNKNLLIVDDQELSNIRKSIDQTPSNYDTDFNMTIPTTSFIQAKVEGLFNSIPSGFKERTGLIIDNNVKVLFEKVVKTRMIRLLNTSIYESYLMSIEDGQYYNIESNPLSSDKDDVNKSIIGGSKMTEFIKNWNSLIIPYATTLANPVFNKLVDKIVSLAAIILENKIWQLEKKVSPLGAIRLEQDVSNIITELTKFDYSLRSKFVKVTQIIMIVGLDDEDEIVALEDPYSGIEWTLTPSERVRARKLCNI